jgi:hypothetical protein
MKMITRRFPVACRFGALAVVLITVTASCGSNADTAANETAAQTDSVVDIDPRMFKSPDWIDTYDPESSAAGYTLVLYRRRVPMLIDMDGKVVHAWHGVRVVGRARLLPSGPLALIGESGDLEEYDWGARKIWSFSLPDPDTFLHHDFIQLENGNFLLLAHDPAVQADFMLEIDRSGEVLWRWEAAEHLAGEFSRAGERNNRTHINSVHELPPNRWFDEGQKEFRPGNILISSRNLNAIYIVARSEGDVVWRFDEGLDYQHEASMIPPRLQGAGNILLFNNGYHDIDGYRQSAILELNPSDGKEVWRYRRGGFYSSTGGTQQSLQNGNLLVTSSQGGRVFELTRDGRIVWQWSPPYLPMRVSRYPEDYSHQLKELGSPSRQPIERRDPDRFIDEDLFTFSLPHETQRLRLDGKSRFVLKNPNRCQILQIPEGAEMVLGFGAKTGDQETPFVRDEAGSARFTATLRLVDTAAAEKVLDRIVNRSDLSAEEGQTTVALLHQKISLRSYESEAVELCLQLTSGSGDTSLGSFVWEEPLIRPPNRRLARQAEAEIDAEALARQEEHLKAIGYLN